MKVTLTKKHTHAGRDLEPGAVIDVDESTAKWLAENGAIASSGSAGASSSLSTSTANVAGKE